MNEIQRNTLGSIWRLCQQMEYAAENGHVATLRAQFLALSKLMARLDMLEKVV